MLGLACGANQALALGAVLGSMLAEVERTTTEGDFKYKAQTVAALPFNSHQQITQTNTEQFFARIHDRKHEHASKSPITAALAGVIRLQIATFSRLFRSTTAS